jgi:hypothetical protein
MKRQILTLALFIIFGIAISFTSCKDASAPVITITGGITQSQTLPSTAGAGTWTNPIATATDDVDGNVSSTVTVTGTVDPNTAGTYTLTYSVTDKAGNTGTEIVTVTIYNSADIIEGTYNNCHDSCQVSPAVNYIAIITASNTVNGEFVVNNFGGFGTGTNVNASLSGTTIIVPSNQPVGGTASIVSASGTIISTSPDILSFTYNWTDGIASETCSSVCQQ